MTSTVSVKGVSKRYGGKVDALRALSFTLDEGETVALVGHNGAGKTTLIKLLLGLIRPTSGEVRVLGEDPAKGDFAVRRALGYLPESVSFHMALTGRETLSFYARLKRVDIKCADGLFERVGLAISAADRPIRTYSKGMRQRLGLAQALLGTPKVLFLDEPTSGLDPALRRNFYTLIDELRAGGTTILLSSHALGELEDRAGRVIIVNRGSQIADGTIDDLRRIASLPSRIRIRPVSDERPGLLNDPCVRWTEAGDGSLEAEVAHSERLPLLHRLSDAASGIDTLTMMEPTLDDLYAHFLNSQEAV
ncbi:ABC transporter ATP-binding protein (plasmid) [Sinorhizobium chiapasense]|uniref:ABC transporter ATP-binding protein n=1 Tax=Sinorhizobium chiapasense TaxID=501572 RepID=UPI002FE33260